MDLCELIRENVSIVDYARRSGFTPVRKGRYYSLKEHDSVMIDVNKNCYWQNSIPGFGKCIGKQGSVIDFAINFNNLSFSEAIRELREEVSTDINYHKKKKEPKVTKASKQFTLPKKNRDMHKIYAYLIKSRCIAPEIVQEFVDKRRLYQDTMGNCVFVGYDIHNPDKPIFACKRGTNTFKPFYGDVEGCDYEQCFYIDNGSDELIITEAVIDAMSVMTLMGKDWKKYNYLVLAGFGKWESIKVYLNTGKISRTIIALDNDEKGIVAAQQICCYIREHYSEIERIWKLPKLKDWNRVLQTISNKQ